MKKKKSGDWIGSMRGSVKILGDIMSPVCEESDWEAAQDEESVENLGKVGRPRPIPDCKER